MPLELLHAPPLDSAGRPLLAPDESISFTSESTRLFLRAEQSEGQGTLYVTTKSDGRQA